MVDSLINEAYNLCYNFTNNDKDRTYIQQRGITMQKFRALAILPYSGIEHTLEQVITEYEELELEICVNDTDDENQIRTLIRDDLYDVVLAANGMREKILKVSKVPCIEFETTIRDVFRISGMLDSFEGFKACMIGNSTCIDCGRAISEMTNREILLYETETPSQVMELIDRSVEEGCELIIGDYMVWRECNKRGISALQIMHGKQSFRKTLKRAVNLCTQLLEKEIEKDILQFIINHPGKFWCISGNGGKTLYDNFEGHEALKESALRQVQKMFGKVREGGFWVDNIYWEFKFEKGKIRDHGPFELLQVYENPDLNVDLKSAYSVNHENYTDNIFNVMMNSTSSETGIRNMVIDSACVDLGVMIYGEKWTGRNSVAYEIHKRSKWKDSYFIKISCSELTDTSVEKLFNPETGRIALLQGGTLFLEDVDELKKDHQKTILRFLSYQQNQKMFRYIASCIHSVQENIDQDILITRLANILGEIEIRVPSLREQTRGIPALAGLALQDMNMKYGWRLSCIEKEGQALLQAYSWPGNLNQFRKVLNSAVSNLFRQPEITKIKTEWIKEAIENSDLQFRKKKPDAITIDGTLEEIERRIITRVLQECDMNLSRAAKRLGIGRSTLYRKIGMDVPK